MARLTPWTLVVVLAAAFAAPARAATDISINVDIRNAPPPPVVVVRHAPRTVLVPQSRVYVVQDAAFEEDCFHYGVWWYIHRDGWWYRARSWRGPFTVIEPRYVPAMVVKVPAKYWRHHPHGMPPGQAKKMVVAKDDHGHGRGRGR
jgi:hypothetical protein